MTRALVLGGGAGIAAPWEAGLIEGFRRAGTDLGTADLIVGTAWGSFVGACLAAGADLNRAMDDVFAADRAQRGPAGNDLLLDKVLRLLSDRSVPRRTRRQRIGEITRRPEVVARAHRLDLIIDCLPVREWPVRPLRLAAVDADSGDRVVWDRHSGVPLAPAVRASASWPSEFPPTEIDGRRYMDGGMFSATNADLAHGCDRLVVLSPMRHVVPARTLDRELASLGDVDVTVIGPDQITVDLFTLTLSEPNIPESAYEAGLRQAADEAEKINATWED
ncbi:patatin-like phospholipase family protein [Actinomadura rayongensis]|uniref:Patatin-like phospholipase family protein n=1 Tax=Actinomadura rayongensis TaxID=1429076 RepID=A0A6I4W3B6_9ACTN|nr:patatin-like phospholipase family protein [Actinomadura rayongensis]MXQ65179.1 patatin-like phospholipase family protein [Actinomadura rayongensis]